MSAVTTENDLLSGQLSHVMTIAKERTGKKPAPATVWRWCKKGVRGGKIKLAAIFHCGCWQTTPQAFDDFLRRQTQAALATESESVVDDELEAAGLL